MGGLKLEIILIISKEGNDIFQNIRNGIITLGCIEVLLFLLLRPDDLRSFFLLCIVLCFLALGLMMFLSSPYKPLVDDCMTGDIIEKDLKSPKKYMNISNGSPVLSSYLIMISINLILYLILYFTEKLI